MTDHTPVTKIVRPFSRGHITIPAEFRRLLGIEEKTELRVTFQDGVLRITPLSPLETPKSTARPRDSRK
jgi:bifunctional DNA-binding transcriptional regulator/antitoxin component of YhaV-PrlF toxin-antitoxin module